MVDSQARQRSEPDLSRLILMTLFFLFHFMLTLRPIFSSRHFEELSESPVSFFPKVMIGVLVLWFLVELLEFLVWNYAWPRRRIGIILAVLRLLPFAAVCVLFPRFVPGMMSWAAPLLTFYLSLVVGQAWGYAVVSLLSLAQFVLSYLATTEGRPPELDHQYELVILIYQVMSVVLMFLFAQSWQNSRKSRERQAALTADIQASQAELRKYASRVSNVVALEERTRIARDIHDNLGHTLMAASIQLNKAEAFFSKDPAVSLKAIVDARSSLQEAMGDVRSTLDTLNERHEGFDLFAQARKPLRSLQEAGIVVRHCFSGKTEGYNVAILLALYRVVQEGATNVLKHAGAREVHLDIRLGDGAASLEFRDDGVGFVAGTDALCVSGGAFGNAVNGVSRSAKGAAAGYGLSGLSDRISLVQGMFEVESSPGKGTILRAVLPKDPVSLIAKEYGDAPAGK